MTGQTPSPIGKFPAARGAGWLSGAWGLVKKQALRLMLISLFFQFLLSFTQVPAFGLLVILFLPVFSAGMLNAFLLVEHGDKPMLTALFISFTDRNRLSKLLLLGAIVMVLGFLIMTMILAGQVVDLDPEIISRIERGDLDALQQIDPKIIEHAVLAMAIGATVSGSITYFSVPLIWFANQGVGNAILLGLKALFRNWKPLLVTGLLLGALAVPIILLFGSFYLSALSDGGGSNILAFLLLVLGPLFQLMLFGTQFLAYKDIFGGGESSQKSDKKGSDQLVA